MKSLARRAAFRDSAGMDTGYSTARQLIVCCDGTNNTLTGGLRDTNVLQLVEELRREGHGQQVLYYDPGVGSPDELPPTGPVQWLRRKWDRVAGLASGQGIFENITEAYAFLMREYREGDQIWLFGFSRGAFTARSVAGLINLFGLLRPEHEVMLPTLLRVYFASAEGRGRDAAPTAGRPRRSRDAVAQQIRASFASPVGQAAAVHFIGVWDTVESVGAPGLALKISSTGTIVGKRMRHVRHALSLDEHRHPFLPRLYADADFGEPTGPQSLRQVWFRGVHSDVGGGYDAGESGLADAALRWMVDEARACGLLGCQAAAQWTRRPGSRRVHDPLYDMPWWAVVGMTVRATGQAARSRAAAPPLGTGHDSLQLPRPGSVWDRHRPLRPLLLGVLGGAAALLLSGYQLMAGSGAADLVAFALDPSRWGEAVGRASRLAMAQAQAFWAPTGPFELAPGACPRRAMLCDLGFLAGYAYVMARLVTRAFARRFACRDVEGPAPRLRVLGAALPLLVGGDLLENGCALAAFSAGPDGWLGPAWFWLGAFGAWAKFVGLAGCLALLGLGWLSPSRRQPRTP